MLVEFQKALVKKYVLAVFLKALQNPVWPGKMVWQGALRRTMASCQLSACLWAQSTFLPALLSSAPAQGNRHDCISLLAAVRHKTVNSTGCMLSFALPQKSGYCSVAITHAPKTTALTELLEVINCAMLWIKAWWTAVIWGGVYYSANPSIPRPNPSVLY